MSFMQAWEAGGQAGQQAKKDKALRQFLVPAMQGQQDAFASLIQSGATGEAMQAQQYASGQAKAQQDAKSAAHKELGALAAQVIKARQAGDPALLDGTYRALVARSRELDPANVVPDQYDENDLPHLYQIAAMGGTTAAEEEYTLSPGAKRFRGSQEIAAAPFAPVNAQLTDVPTGDGGSVQMVWDPRARQFTQPNYGGRPQGGAQTMDRAYQGAMLDPVTDFQHLASMPGVQVTSLRRDAGRNAKVGGQSNSFHLTGEAGDFVVPQAQKAAFIASARARGYEAIDEGDHIHVEPPRSGITASQFGAGQRLGIKPPKAGGSDLERRIDLARQMGASDAEIRQMVIGREGAAAGAKPMPTSALKIIQEETNAANTAQGINTLLGKHLSRLQSGELDFGPVANRLNEARNFAGASNAQSRNYQEFKSDLERLRNESLRLNSGVQTDGDAQRAWNELFANLNDKAYVKQRLETIVQLNERARSLRMLNADMVRENYGRSEPVGSNFSGVSSSSSSTPQRRSTDRPAQPRRLKFNPATGRIE